jgi:hypothetical protein
LNANGPTTINIIGPAPTVGSYPLIDYSTITGSGGSFRLGTQPPGIAASIVTNVNNSSIDLVVSGPANDFNRAFVSGGNLVLTGTGAPNGTYAILTSTNVADPLSTWATNNIGNFDGSGTFSNAIPIGPDPQRFFILKTP